MQQPWGGCPIPRTVQSCISDYTLCNYLNDAKVGIFADTTKLLWQKLCRAGDIVPFSVLVVAIFAEKEEIWQKRETYI